MTTAPFHPSLILAAVLFAAAAPAAAQDPRPPKGGFPIAEYLDRLVVFGDGYKTRIDVRLPDPARVKAPPQGWPGMLLVHGLGSNRKAGPRTWGRIYAGLGYVTIAYDVRGQGETRTLNQGGGTTFIGALEIGDMAELLLLVETKLKHLLDSTRLVVRGTSQGGFHAFAAAAWSGRRLPAPRATNGLGTITTFPKILAVAPGAAHGDPPRTFLPDGNAFSGRWIVKFFGAASAVVIEPAFRAQVRDIFLKQDFPAARKLAADPWRDFLSGLKTTSTAVFAHVSWSDYWFPVNPLADTLNALPQATPRRAYCSTGNHGTARVAAEEAHWQALERRWFERFVKGRRDEIDRQPRFHLSIPPDRAAASLDPKGIWAALATPSFPRVPGVSARRLYLRTGARLLASAPVTAETPERIDHKVPAGYGPLAWTATGNLPAKVFQAIPLSQVWYRAAPETKALLLLGRPHLRLWFSSTAPNLQVHASLYVEDASGANLRYVTGGFRALRARRAGRSFVDVELGDVAFAVERGRRLVLSIENHGYHRPPGHEELRTAPYFESYSFQILHEPNAASVVELPVAGRPASVRFVPAEASRSATVDAALRLLAGPERAGFAYVLLAGVSGTVPGIPFGGGSIPLNPDALTVFALQVTPQPPFQAFSGVLDATGRAAARFTAPAGLLPAAWSYGALSVTALLIDRNFAPSLTNATELRILP